jgi:hypothetical protein
VVLRTNIVKEYAKQGVEQVLVVVFIIDLERRAFTEGRRIEIPDTRAPLRAWATAVRPNIAPLSIDELLPCPADGEERGVGRPEPGAAAVPGRRAVGDAVAGRVGLTYDCGTSGVRDPTPRNTTPAINNSPNDSPPNSADATVTVARSPS